MPVVITLGGPGSYFIEDDDQPGNAAATVRIGTVNVLDFAYPADALSFSSASGQALTFNLFDPLQSATLLVGSLSDATQNPDTIAVRKVSSTAAMTMVARNTITESGNDTAADIVATNLTLSAGKGIGVGNALETQVSRLEASSNTGGINIVNLMGLTIGGTAAELGGVSAGTSGNIRIEAFGSIVLDEDAAASTVNGGSSSGNVTLIANGSGSITSIVNNDAVTAAGGNIVLTAGGNVRFGRNTDFDNDVRAKGSITVNAGGDFWLDGFSDFSSGDFGGSGTLTINAAKGIFILDSFGADASVSALGTSGADINLTTGPGGTLNLQARSSGTLFSQSGDVTASADIIAIAADSGITAGKGVVTLRPATAGLAINVGSDSEAAGRLALSDAELDRVFAQTLVIGGAEAGEVTVTKNITPANVTDVMLQSGTDIIVNAGLLVQAAGKLELRAGDDIVLSIGASLQAPGGLIGRVDFGNTDPGTGGKAFVDAAFATAVTFIGNADADTLFGGAAGDTLDGAGGADTMTGRAGDDIYRVDDAGDVVVELAGGGTADRVLCSADYTLKAGVQVELMTTNTAAGTAGIDLTGNELAQTITGNAGGNILDGKAGNDVLRGLGGKDFFVFSTAPGAGNVDTVADFIVVDDTVRLENAIFTKLAALGALNLGLFRATSAGEALDANDFVLYDTDDGRLFYDADGNGAGIRIHFATLTGAPAVANTDFVVV